MHQSAETGTSTAVNHPVLKDGPCYLSGRAGRVDQPLPWDHGPEAPSQIGRKTDVRMLLQSGPLEARDDRSER